MTEADDKEECRYNWKPGIWIPPEERPENTGQLYFDGECLRFGVVCDIEIV